jgi:hypothetical protein
VHLKRKLTALLAPMLGALGLVAAAPATATVTSIQGAYVIEGLYSIGGVRTTYGCVVAGVDGRSAIPSLYNWGQGTNLCSQAAGPIAPTAIWDVYMLRSFVPEKSAYVIRSRVDGRCWTRGNSGTDASVTLYKWGESTDLSFCGFRSLQDFFANGQAAWNLEVIEDWPDDAMGGTHVFTATLGMSTPTSVSLGVTPMPVSRPYVAETAALAFWARNSSWAFRFRTVTP